LERDGHPWRNSHASLARRDEGNARDVMA